LSDEYGFWKTSCSRHGPTFEHDVAARQRDEADRGARERRLAAARLAHEPDDPSTFDRDARARDRTHPSAPPVVVDDDVVELERAHSFLNGSL
jgi:hypothetical protein